MIADPFDGIITDLSTLNHNKLCYLETSFLGRCDLFFVSDCCLLHSALTKGEYFDSAPFCFAEMAATLVSYSISN